MLPFFQINKTVVGSYLNPAAVPGRNHAFGASQGVMNRRTLQSNGSRGTTRVTASGTQVDRYAPNQEGLDRDSLLDDITPKSDQALATLFEKMYQQDAVSGTAIDMLRNFAWSDYTLTGIKDPDVMKLFTDAMEMFNPVVTMPEIHGDVLKHGRSISSLIFSGDTQTWTDIIPHRIIDCELTPIPMRGFDPLVDVITSPEMRHFIDSRDERMQYAKRRIPERLLKAFKGAKAQLDQQTTLFVPRRVSMTDWKGTSLFWRVLPYYAVEKALMQSTISSARRRTRSILHAQVGIDNVWEPTDDELMQVTTLFLETEEDPAGAVLATRNGINVSEVRSGNDHWKISDEQDQLRAGKLNGLGMSEAIISGEANFNTMDATLTLFVEGQKIARTAMTNIVLYRMLFTQIARANGLVKTNKSTADAAHGVRTGGRRLALASPLSIEDALKIPFKDLEMPVIHWTKNLSPQSDQAYLDVLEKVESKGVVIPISMWASAAGVDLNQVMDILPDDKKLREKLKKFAPKPAQEDGGGFGGGAFGSTRSLNQFMVDDLGIGALGSIIGFGPDKTILGISVTKVYDLFNTVTANNRSMELLSDWPAFEDRIRDEVDNDRQVDTVKYLFTRAGFAKCPVDEEFLLSVAESMAEASKAEDITRTRLEMIRSELLIIAKIVERSREMKEHANPTFYQIANGKIKRDVAEHAARRVLKSFTGQIDNLPSKYLYSGLTNAG